MTGPGPGKVELKNARVMLMSASSSKAIDAKVYVHLKGYSRARVTHLDVESYELNDLVPPGRGGFCLIQGARSGLLVDLSRISNRYKLLVEHEALKGVIEHGKTYWCYVGGKDGGIYIGVKKEIIAKLEEIARKLAGGGLELWF